MDDESDDDEEDEWQEDRYTMHIISIADFHYRFLINLMMVRT